MHIYPQIYVHVVEKLQIAKKTLSMYFLLMGEETIHGRHMLVRLDIKIYPK
jgi:hypothetical protein